ncbi:MAG: phenylalanine--tRNA ligase subunit beta [Planctomycetota bacterium]
MLISLRWLNDCLDHRSLGPISADDADRVLTDAGFPIEEREELPSGDIVLDVEVTSNRGDVLSHIGMAREVAAATGRVLKLPKWDEPTREGSIDDALTLANDEPDVCPLFTAQVIRNVKVGPSPSWLVERLEAIGQRSINNVVDVTNYITFELGHPCHVFDLAKLAGDELRIRFAEDGETLRTLQDSADDKPRKLLPTDLVVADADRPQSLAGVIGGYDSQVDNTTTDVVLEMATWDPVTIRTAARRLAIRTDAGYRFERGVAPSEISFAAFRTAALIQELAGGTICEGVLEDGQPIAHREPVRFRPGRARRLLGLDTNNAEQQGMLERLEIDVIPHKPDGDEDDEPWFECTVPPFRLDLTREIDLVEEVARVAGLGRIPTERHIGIVAKHPQESERAVREIGAVLTGLGYFEAVTFSFASETAAKPFIADGLRLLKVDDERRGSEPYLRPSPLTGLLTCRRANQDAQASQPGGLRLYEIAAAFAEHDKPGRNTVEHRNVAMLADVSPYTKKTRTEDLQRAIRQMRGSIEALVTALAGSEAVVSIEPAKPASAAFQADAFANVVLEGKHLGSFGLIAESEIKRLDLDTPVVAAELNLAELIALYPPKASVQPLPAFPAMERDITLDLPDTVRWAQVEALVQGRSPALLEATEYVGVYRGKPVPAGTKSLTFRLRFRDPSRTLKREEVEPQVADVIEAAKAKLGAEIRA